MVKVSPQPPPAECHRRFHANWPEGCGALSRPLGHQALMKSLDHSQGQRPDERTACFLSPAVDDFSEVVPNDHAQFFHTKFRPWFHTMGTLQVRRQPISVLLCTAEGANSDATGHA